MNSQQQLDPTKPAEAALILYRVTRQLALSANDHDALATAHRTLLDAVTPKADTKTPEHIISFAQYVLERMGEDGCNLNKTWHEVKEILEYVAFGCMGPNKNQTDSVTSKFVPN